MQLPAQEEMRSFIVTLLEDYAAEQDVELTEDDGLVDALMELIDNPIDLNVATRQQLEKLPFLSDFQIESLLAHIYINGPIEQVYELSAVDGFSSEDVTRLVPFVRILTIPESGKWKSAVRGSFLGRGSGSLPRAIGYKAVNDSVGPPYKGRQIKILQKSNLKFGDHVEAGWLVESDAGEPMFAQGIKAFDFMSGYVVVKPSKSFVRKVVIGDFSARFGQGLGVWSGMSMGMTSENTTLRRRGSGLTRYSSSGESAFLRGGGVEVKYLNHALSIFGSYKPLDASVADADSSGVAAVSVLRNTGLHRTAGELQGRHAIGESLMGGYYQYGGAYFKAGVGGAVWNISSPLLPSDNLYRQYYFTGSTLNTVFADYVLFLGRLHLYGEAAMQDFNNIAVTQGVDMRLSGGVEMTLAYRRFDRGYTVLFQQPFSRSSSPGGESGVYGAVKFQPHRNVTVTSALNYYRFQWLRYRVSAPSSGFDYNMWVRLRADYSNRLLFRYKYSDTWQDLSSSVGNGRQVTVVRRHNFNMQWQHKISDVTDFQTIASFVRYSKLSSSTSVGYWFSQDARLQFPGINLTVLGRVAHFDTDDYDSRIYVYEPDVLYAFSVPARSGNGILAMVNTSWKISKSLQCWARVQHVYRRDTEFVGSGYNMVDAPHVTEIKFQLRYVL